MNFPRTLRRRLVFAVAVTAVLLIGSGSLVYAGAGSWRSPEARTSPVPPCADRSAQPPPSGPPGTKPTTITTLQQAYECIFAHHYLGPVLDDRVLLTTAFGRFTAALQRRGADRPQATLPELTGDRGRDWAAFARMYAEVLGALPDDAELRQALAAEVMQGMIDSLQDNHNGWIRGPQAAPDFLRLGFTPGFEGRRAQDLRESTAPMFVARLAAGSPAAAAGLRVGDVIEAVDGVPTFLNGRLTAGILDSLRLRAGRPTVKITVHRPATGATWTVDLTGAARPVPPLVEPAVRLLDGGVAYALYPSFDKRDADRVLARIAELRAGASVRGVVLDIRGNGGGGPEAVSTLLGAFAHGRTWAWNCDIKGRCGANRTDDSVPLLNLRLVVLTDSECYSACDAFSAGVRGLKLGPLVGMRTGGMVSGLPVAYSLEDGSGLALTPLHHFGPNREIVDDFGVAVDHQAPTTARDLSAGRDPGLEKALSLLTG